MLLMSGESSLDVIKELMVSCEGETQRKAINMLNKKLENRKRADVSGTEVGLALCCSIWRVCLV